MYVKIRLTNIKLAKTTKMPESPSCNRKVLVERKSKERKEITQFPKE
jgi:hypothetical protein